MNNNWHKTWWGVLVIIICIIFVIYFISRVIDSYNQTQKEVNGLGDSIEQGEKNIEKLDEAIEKSKSYQEVFQFEGNGAKKSDTFEISGDKFKIKYNCQSNGICSAVLKSPNNESTYELIMNTTDSVEDETILYGSGEYYIDSNSMGTYKMIVEDYK